MWRFFFGLLRTHSSKSTTKLFEKFAHIHTFNRNDITVLLCAYELKQTAIAEVLVQALNYSIIRRCNTPSDCAAIGYALSLGSHQFNKLVILMNLIIFPTGEYDIEACFVSTFADLPESNKVVQVALHDLLYQTERFQLWLNFPVFSKFTAA